MNVTETVQKKGMPSEARGNLMAKTGFTFIRLMLAHPLTFMQNRTMRPDEQRYVLLPIPYELPSFRKGMKYSTSNEPYLRPTQWCDPREPEVVAMAHELGAYELSDREFAEAAYWFVKEQLQFQILPMNSAGETLKRGSGSCIHLISLFNALCRCAGIKARYKFFAMNYDRYATRGVGDPMWDNLYNALGYLMSEAEAEVYLDGAWTVAHPATPGAVQAARGMPVTRLGEDSIGTFFDVVPGTIKRLEAVPPGMNRGMKMLLWLTPASPERVALGYQRAAMHGRQVIAEAGGLEAYDRMARERRQPPSAPTIEARDDTAIVFEE